MNSSYKLLNSLISPLEVLWISDRNNFSFSSKTKSSHLVAKLLIRDSTIEVLVDSSHHLVNLLLSDCVAEPLKHVLELFNIDETILVQINLLESFSQT